LKERLLFSIISVPSTYRIYIDRQSLSYDEMGFVGCSFVKVPLGDPLTLLYTNEYISGVFVRTAKKF